MHWKKFSGFGNMQEKLGKNLFAVKYEKMNWRLQVQIIVKNSLLFTILSKNVIDYCKR